MTSSVSRLIASIDSALVNGSNRRGCRACTARRIFSPTLSSGKQIGDLERAADARFGNLFRRVPRDGLAHQCRLPFVRREHAGQKIERRGLACAIGADQSVQRAISDGNVDSLHRLDAAETLDHVAGGQHRSFDQHLRPQKFRQRQRLNLACRHRRILGHLLAEWRKQSFADADQAGRREHDEADEDEAEPQQPVLGVDPEKFAEQDEEQCPERRAEKAAHAADHNHRQQFAGETPPRSDRPRSCGSCTAAGCRRARSTPRTTRTRQACSGWSDSRETARAVRSRGSPPARCRQSELWNRHSSTSTAKAMAATNQ